MENQKINGVLINNQIEKQKQQTGNVINTPPQPLDENDFILKQDPFEENMVPKKEATHEQNGEENTIEIIEEVNTNHEKEVEIEIIEDVDEINKIAEVEIEEQQEEIWQFVVINEIQDMIEEDLYNLKQIEFELHVLEQEKEKEVETKKIENLQKELEELLRRLEKIKDNYKEFGANSDLDIDDELFRELVTNYKENVPENVSIESNRGIEEIEEYISVFEKIYQIEQEANELEDVVDDTLEEFNIRDEEFEEMKEKYEDIEEVQSQVDTFLEAQMKKLDELEGKIKNSETIQTKIETEISFIPDLTKIIQATLLLAAAKQIPPTPRGYFLKAALIVGATSAAADFIKTKENKKKVTTIRYTDYQNNIKRSMTSLNGIVDQIDTTSKEIDEIVDDFTNDLSQYQGQIPEYDEFMTNILAAQKELQTAKKTALKHKDDFEKVFEKHSAKIKKLDDLKN